MQTHRLGVSLLVLSGYVTFSNRHFLKLNGRNITVNFVGFKALHTSNLLTNEESTMRSREGECTFFRTATPPSSRSEKIKP